MADHDGHTINVGPVTVGEIVTGGEGSDVGESATATESRTAPTPFGDSARWGAVDPDRTRAWLADNWPKGNHLTIVLHDYCDEVDRLRAENAALRDLVARFYTQAWEDPLTDDEMALLDPIVNEAQS